MSVNANQQQSVAKDFWKIMAIMSIKLPIAGWEKSAEVLPVYTVRMILQKALLPVDRVLENHVLIVQLEIQNRAVFVISPRG